MTPSSLVDAISRPDNFLLQILEDIRGENPEAARRPARTGLPGFDFGAQVGARGLVPVLEEDLYNPVADFLSGAGSRLLFGPQQPDQGSEQPQPQPSTNKIPQPQGREIDIQEILAAAGVVPGDTQRGGDQGTPFFKVGSGDTITNNTRGSFSRASGRGFETPREARALENAFQLQMEREKQKAKIWESILGSAAPNLATKSLIDLQLMDSQGGASLQQLLESIRGMGQQKFGEDMSKMSVAEFLDRMAELQAL